MNDGFSSEASEIRRSVSGQTKTQRLCFLSLGGSAGENNPSILKSLDSSWPSEGRGLRARLSDRPEPQGIHKPVWAYINTGAQTAEVTILRCMEQLGGQASTDDFPRRVAHFGTKVAVG